MSVLRYFARNSIIRLGAFGVGAMAAFVVTPHLLEALHKPAYGAWTLISSLYTWYMLLDFGLLQAVASMFGAAAARKHEGDLDGIYTTACCLAALGGLLALAAGGACALLTGRFVSTEVDVGAAAQSVLLFSFSLAWLVFCRCWHGVLMAELRWTVLSFVGVGKTLLTSAAVLLWMDAGLPPSANLVRMAWIASLGNMLEGLFQYLLARRHLRGRFKKAAFSLARARELLRFGSLVVISQAGNILRSSTPPFIVAAVLGLAPTAVFSLARQFVNYMSGAMLGAFGIMSPYFSRAMATGDEKECRRSLVLSLWLSNATACYIALCLCFYSGLFLERWVGPGYAGAQTALVPMALAGMLEFGQYPGAGFLTGLGRHRILASTSVLEGALITSLGIPATRFWGLAGMGWTMFALAVLIRLAILPRRISREAGLPLWSLYAATAGALIPQAAAQWAYYAAIRPWLEPGYLALFLACAGQGMVTLVLLAASVRLLQWCGRNLAAKKARAEENLPDEERLEKDWPGEDRPEAGQKEGAYAAP